jgi:hypothetical protein
MNTIRIRKISTETKVIYALWACFIAVLLMYIGLMAGAMVYGVEKKTADRSVQRYQRMLADTEASLLRSLSSLTLGDAYKLGLVSLNTRVAVTGDVVLGRAE